MNPYKIKLYHYSNVEDIDKVKPCYFNGEGFTALSGQLSNVKRSYWYVDSLNVEPSLKSSRCLYTCEVIENSIYNVNIDSLKFNKFLTFNEILRKVKSLNYKGIIGNTGRYNIVCLFYNQKVKRV